MDISLSNCFVTVHDPDIALTFYRDVLGLELRNEVSTEGFRWLTLSPRSQPELEIVLMQPHAGRGPEDGDRFAELLAKGSLPGINFKTDDVDETFEKIRASGAEVMQEPADQFWGVRDCAFRDPSGNMIRIAGR